MMIWKGNFKEIIIDSWKQQMRKPEVGNLDGFACNKGYFQAW